MPTATSQVATSNGNLDLTESTGKKTSIQPNKQHVDAKELGLDPELKTSYPTQALNFLKKLRLQNDPQNVTLPDTSPIIQAKLKMNILLVGAGLGGLAAAIALVLRGHTVTVLEQAAQLGEVGAGIQIPPNTGRLLRRWGVLKYLEELAVKPSCINVRRWQDGSVIGHTRLEGDFQDNFEIPYYVSHRAHLHQALVDRAVELGVKVRLNSKVVTYKPESASVQLEDGTLLSGDFVVAADGIKSLAREVIQSSKSTLSTFTGFAAYRATVDVEKMKTIESLRWIFEKPTLNVWVGENKHVMTYMIAGGKAFNMVLCHLDFTDSSTWNTENAVDEIKHEFDGWDSQLTTIMSLIDSSLKWPLRTSRPLSNWADPSSRLVILGDAAHAMVPYMSQGAAMAMEDGAALAFALSNISSFEELPFALKLFQEERIKRSSGMQEASMVNGLMWHFPDGPEQQARDAAMRAEVDGKPFTASANQWSDPVTQAWAYGYNAEEAMEKRWDEAIRAMILQNTGPGK